MATLSNIFCLFIKRVYSEREEFAPKGSKFFPFGIDSFQKVFVFRKVNRKSQNCLPCKIGGWEEGVKVYFGDGESTRCTKSP